MRCRVGGARIILLRGVSALKFGIAWCIARDACKILVHDVCALNIRAVGCRACGVCVIWENNVHTLNMDAAQNCWVHA
jgi:hypothetical protein